MIQGYTYEIFHSEDYDPDCDVCVYATVMLHKILGEWIDDAIFVDRGSDYSAIDPKRLVILDKSDRPMMQRILGWFVENFETIRFAGVNKIMFRDSDTNVSVEYIITY